MWTVIFTLELIIHFHELFITNQEEIEIKVQPKVRGHMACQEGKKRGASVPGLLSDLEQVTHQLSLLSLLSDVPLGSLTCELLEARIVLCCSYGAHWGPNLSWGFCVLLQNMKNWHNLCAFVGGRFVRWKKIK